MTYSGVQANRQSVSTIKSPTGALRGKRPAIVAEPDPESDEVYGPIDYGESRIYISDAYYDEVYQQSPPTQPQTSSNQLPHPAPLRTSPSSPPPCRTLRKKLSNLLSHCSQFGSHWNTGMSNSNPRSRGRDTAKHGLEPQYAPHEDESTTQILSYSIPSTYSRLLPLEVAQKRDDIVYRLEGYEMTENRTC